MNRHLTVIDSQTAGISGDMLLGALIDTGANLKAIQKVLELIPQHFLRCKSLRLETREVRKHGFRTCSVNLTISEKDEETMAQELIHSTHEIADAAILSEKAKSFAVTAIQVLAEVESKLHGVEISKAHLHEAGSTDTLADVFGVAAACDSLNLFESEILATPVAVGGGPVSFSHGTLATPAPAVLEIARKNGIPIIGGPEPGELATPTGISMLASMANRFLEIYPPIIPEKIGYGAGKLDLVKAPNFLRVVLGRSISPGRGSDVIQVLETNIDDVSGEILGHALQRILDSGAKDAWITSALFKKNRPGHVLHAICDPRDAQGIADIMIRETGTFGVRFQQWNRFTLQREVSTIKLKVAGRVFDVRVKFARDIVGKIVRVKPEFEDVRAVAEAVGMSAREVSNLVMRDVQAEDRKS